MHQTAVTPNSPFRYCFALESGLIWVLFCVGGDSDLQIKPVCAKILLMIHVTTIKLNFFTLVINTQVEVLCE